MYVSVHVFFPGKYHTEAEVNISTSLDSFSLKAKNINFLLRVAHRARKNLQNFRIFWGPPFWKDRMGAAPQDWETPVGDEKNRESKDRMGRLPFYPGYRCQAESRIEGRLPFYLVKKAALKGRLPIPILSCQKGGPWGAAPILSWLQAESRICGFCLFARIEWRPPLTLGFWTHSILAIRRNPEYPGKNPWKSGGKNGKKTLKKDKKRLKTVKKDEKRRKNSESGKNQRKTAKNTGKTAKI